MVGGRGLIDTADVLNVNPEARPMMTTDQATVLSLRAFQRSLPAATVLRPSPRTDSAVPTAGPAGFADVWQAAGAQIADSPRRPLARFQEDLHAIQDQLIDGERILEIRTLQQGMRGHATGAMALTTHRLLVVDVSKLPDPVAETVLFSEIKHVGCRRRGLSGLELTVRTQLGKQYRGIEGKDRATTKRFVAALRGQVDNPSASQLSTLPPGSVAAGPPTALARVQRMLGLAQSVFTALLPLAAILFLTGVVSHSVSVGVFACFAFSRAAGKFTGFADRALAARRGTT